ncbi:hypothetical protein Trydic_g17324, partial [Trypoxylus dichotomus]
MNAVEVTRVLSSTFSHIALAVATRLELELNACFDLHNTFSDIRMHQ